MTRKGTRGRLGLTASGLLVGSLAAGLLAAPPATAEPRDYTLTVDPATAGPKIDDTMYGVFYEDINHAADGGLYAELVQNRSFEYSTADHQDYTPMTGWGESSAGGASGTARVVDDGERLNGDNRNYLQLDLAGDGEGGSSGYGVANSGYHSGIAVEQGGTYDFSVWARTDQRAGTRLTVAVEDETGRALTSPLRVTVRGDGWTKYEGTLAARETTDAARLAVRASGSGTVRLDMVSLFPRDTFRGHENGMRKDLAEKIADLDPGFLRFPGGCLVNTGSHEAYEAPNWERERSYQWKDTVGPVEERPTNHNFWGYNQSYGIGYYEYFRFAEDIGAAPLPVVPALVTGCGQNQATDDPELLRRHIQDTLDLIEFANGPADSTWGKLRADMGHPEPFGLTHLAVGNEENLPDAYFERFTQFREAIEAEYPDITVVGNSGPSASGTTFDRLWQLNREAGVELVDEHYYRSPQWFLENNERYDSYDRQGPKVFLGEYASQDNKFFNALSEAAYMTGLERNADLVKMASYAPLLAHQDGAQWTPDMIWFDNTRSWGSTSYEVQKLFMNNTGDRVVPSEASATSRPDEPSITGSVGLSTWNTSAAYDDVEVTSADGGTLLSDDFSAGDDQWTHATGAGSWAVEDGAYVQSDTGAENTMVTAGDTGWQNYDLRVKATKKSGDEGFLIGFGVQDTDNYYWWNLGGWGNTSSAVEKSSDGAKETMVSKGTTIDTDREYDVRVQVRDREVTLFLDGEKWGSFTDEDESEPFRQVVTRDEQSGELIVKVVNAQESPARTEIDLGGLEVAPTAQQTVLSGDPDAENTATERPVKPEHSEVTVSGKFTHTFPAHSVTFLRIKEE